MRHVCLRNPCFWGNLNLHSLPEAWGPWEPQYPPPVLNYCIMPIPLLQLQEKHVLCKELNNCQDWAFSNSGLEVGLPAFQLPMFAKGDALLKGVISDMFVKESMFLWKSKSPLPTRSLRSLRSAAHFNSSALCLCKRSHPFVAAAEKTCLMQRIEQLPRLTF